MKVREPAALRQRRLERGLSQRELAYLARPCSQTTIYLLETAQLPRVNDRLASRIARRLEVPLGSLFEGD
ncbi:MAG: helix-turn-helix transcriptional regulator [Angustibacter sp.]